jgi:hypothetical protein
MNNNNLKTPEQKKRVISTPPKINKKKLILPKLNLTLPKFALPKIFNDLKRKHKEDHYDNEHLIKKQKN